MMRLLVGSRQWYLIHRLLHLCRRLQSRLRLSRLRQNHLRRLSLRLWSRHLLLSLRLLLHLYRRLQQMIWLLALMH
jgi:hypothetical protein